MTITVHKSELVGETQLPGSKSIMQRFLVAAALTKGTSIIREPARNDDSLFMIQAIRELGAEIEFDKDDLVVTGNLQWPANPLNVGESGLGMRLLIPVASLFDKSVKVIGTGTLRSRPIDEFGPALESLGVSFHARGGKLPATVKGPLKGGSTTVNGSISSQYLSGLLMAAPLCEQDTVIAVEDLKSKPYVDLTLEVMRDFGIEVENNDYRTFRVKGKQVYKPSDVTVRGDWSGGAALLVAGAVGSRNGIKIKGLDYSYTQADRAISGVLLFAGARLMQEEDGVAVFAPKLRSFSFDATDCPDLFPVLAALAVKCNKPSTITGVSRLEHKESNRAVVIRDEFAKAGIRVELNGDEMVVHPGVPQPCTIDSHHDHRIVMAAAILGIIGGPIEILHAESVSKSFDSFFGCLMELGVKLSKKK
ncbi:MAG: 3-phosphoshikimate 1-carboxyvinyltransferase [Bacteroidota bacterium]